MKNYVWSHTRIHRQGMRGYKNIKARKGFRHSAIYLAVFFIFAMTYVWSRIQVTETGYRLRQLEEKGEQLKEENRSLTVEAATLKSPQRLEKLAVELSLQRPVEGQVFFIRPILHRSLLSYEKKDLPAR